QPHGFIVDTAQLPAHAGGALNFKKPSVAWPVCCSALFGSLLLSQIGCKRVWSSTGRRSGTVRSQKSSTIAPTPHGEPPPWASRQVDRPAPPPGSSSPCPLHPAGRQVAPVGIPCSGSARPLRPTSAATARRRTGYGIGTARR